MQLKISVLLGVWLLLVPATFVQEGDSTPAIASSASQGPAAKPADKTVNCRVMEAFVSEQLGVAAIIFHQRDKAEGPKLGELLLAHSGEEMEFEARDAQWHRVKVFRVKSCFGRGLMLFATREAKLVAKDEFVLRLGEKN